MKLEATKIIAIAEDCVFKNPAELGMTPDEYQKAKALGKFPDICIISEGITANFGFHKGRLESHREEVKELLAELPDEFDHRKSGGWAFLNACVDKHGVRWGNHKEIEVLMCLGQALGFVHIAPRDMWKMLPGGVPYFSVDLEPKGA